MDVSVGEEPPKVEKVQDGVFVDVTWGQEKRNGMFKMDMYTMYIYITLYIKLKGVPGFGGQTKSMFFIAYVICLFSSHAFFV